MNTTLVMENFLSWGLQVSLLIAVAALVSLRWDQARAKLVFWHGVLLIVLLLPIAVPWHQPPPEALANSFISVTQGPLVPVETGRSLLARICNLSSILWLIGAGAVGRFLWIGAGMLRLRRLRLRADPIAAPGFFADHVVRWYSSEEISGPVTFGCLRPCVLLPARVASLPDAVREAIACHELLHIERRDWLFVLAEEVIRGALWFHPGVWFALARIQLAREQAVDEEVVRRTSDREGYVDALLAVAGHRLEPDVAPAPLFLKKRHLAVRVAAVVKEATMSRTGSLIRFASAACAALAAVVLAVWMFPFESQAQALPDDAGITCDAGAALLHRPPLRYPEGAIAGGIVTLDATVNAKGEVTDARVLSGPEELRKAALENVLQFHYSSDPAPTSARITIQFRPRGSAPTAAPRTKALPRNPSPESLITNIQFAGLSAELSQRVRDRLPLREGDTYSADAAQQLRTRLSEIDEHLLLGVRASRSASGRGEVSLTISVNGTPLLPPPPPPPPPAPVVADANGPRLQVGGNVQSANLVIKVTPAYPPEAKQARVQGTVSLAVLIGKDGVVLSVDVISGHPLLAESAVDAVRQWIYKPTLLNGQPVEVATQVNVNFTLAQ